MINYQIIADSVAFYINQGFSYMETPWLIDKAADDATRLPHGTIYEVNGNKRLPASGEQSFINMMLLGQLPTGKYVTVTPCFRDDDVDLIHKKWFLKTELIITDLSAFYPNLKCMVAAKNFFSKQGIPYNDIETVKTKNGHDLIYKDIELGSYGYREYGNLKWVYGTGVAEPRFSTTLEIYGLS